MWGTDLCSPRSWTSLVEEFSSVTQLSHCDRLSGAPVLVSLALWRQSQMCERNEVAGRQYRKQCSTETSAAVRKWIKVDASRKILPCYSQYVKSYICSDFAGQCCHKYCAHYDRNVIVARHRGPRLASDQRFPGYKACVLTICVAGARDQLEEWWQVHQLPHCHMKTYCQFLGPRCFMLLHNTKWDQKGSFPIPLKMLICIPHKFWPLTSDLWPLL